MRQDGFIVIKKPDRRIFDKNFLGFLDVWKFLFQGRYSYKCHPQALYEVQMSFKDGKRVFLDED